MPVGSGRSDDGDSDPFGDPMGEITAAGSSATNVLITPRPVCPVGGCPKRWRLLQEDPLEEPVEEQAPPAPRESAAISGGAAAGSGTTTSLCSGQLPGKAAHRQLHHSPQVPGREQRRVPRARRSALPRQRGSHRKPEWQVSDRKHISQRRHGPVVKHSGEVVTANSFRHSHTTLTKL